MEIVVLVTKILVKTFAMGYKVLCKIVNYIFIYMCVCVCIVNCTILLANYGYIFDSSNRPLYH